MTNAHKKLLADGKVLRKAKRIYPPGTKVLTLSPHEHSTPKLVGSQLKKLNDTGNILVITDSEGVWVYRGGVWASKFESEKSVNDPVNRPSHYTDGKIEVIDFIEDKKLGFHLGNTVKYVARAGKKDSSKTIQDLEKAKWYLERYINKLKTIQK